MKKLVSIVVAVLVLSASKNVSAQQAIQFENINISAALAKSKITHKPVFLMGYASWCAHCNKMKAQVFTDSAVAEFYNRHFICIKQDMEKGVGVQLHETFKIKSYPTFIFFDSNDSMIYRAAGEFKDPEFIAEGMNALNPAKQIPFLKQQFEKDTSNANNCYDYLRTLKKADLDYAGMVTQYLSTQSETALLSEVNWRIIANGITDINSREFQFVLHHQKEFAALTSPERVERKIYYLVKDMLVPFINAKDTVSYAVYRKPAAAIKIPEIDSLLFICDLQLDENIENWDAYKKHTLQWAQTYVANEYSQLNAIATVYLKHITDKAALLQAISWANRSLLLHEDYSTYLLNAKLRQKINDMKGFIEKLKQAKQLALKYGWDFTEAAQLLKEYDKNK